METFSNDKILNCSDISKLYTECMLQKSEPYCNWIKYRYSTCSIMCSYKQEKLCDRYIKIVGDDILKTIIRNKIEEK